MNERLTILGEIRDLIIQRLEAFLQATASGVLNAEWITAPLSCNSSQLFEKIIIMVRRYRNLPKVAICYNHSFTQIFSSIKWAAFNNLKLSCLPLFGKAGPIKMIPPRPNEAGCIPPPIDEVCGVLL